jgi:hypothetical protein
MKRGKCWWCETPNQELHPWVEYWDSDLCAGENIIRYTCKRCIEELHSEDIKSERLQPCR